MEITGQLMKEIEVYYTALSSNIFLLSIMQMIMMWIILLVIGTVINLIATVFQRVLAIILGNKASFIICNYLTYPGTVHHELSHALLATCSGAQVRKITLIPNENTLGRVDFRTRGGRILGAVQMVLASAAPIICGLCSLYAMMTFAYPLCTKAWHFIIWGYFFASILVHMTLSKKDINNIFRGMPICSIIIYIILVIINMVNL
ncbi:MAG: M50 family metallopeptidase [Butyrivibrio sp.]|nr:M50 family metallopeptidase [Butyrivibrio sp.]